MHNMVKHILIFIVATFCCLNIASVKADVKTNFDTAKVIKDIEKQISITRDKEKLNLLYFQLGFFNQTINRYEQSIKAFDKVSDEWLGEIAYQKANPYYELKKYDKALYFYNYALNRNSKNDNNRQTIGFLLKRMGICNIYLSNFEMAENNFKDFLNLSANEQVSIFYPYIYTLWKEGKFQECLNWIEKKRIYDASNKNVIKADLREDFAIIADAMHLDLILEFDILVRNKKYDKLEERILSLENKEKIGYKTIETCLANYAKALLLYDENKYLDAINIIDNEANKQNFEYLFINLKAKNMLALGEVQSALNLINSAIAKYNFSEYYETRGDIYAYLKKKKLAISDYKKALVENVSIVYPADIQNKLKKM